MAEDIFSKVRFITEVPLHNILFDSFSFNRIARMSSSVRVYIIHTEPFGFMYTPDAIYWFSYFLVDNGLLSIISLKNFDNVIEKIDPEISKEFLFHLDIFKNSIELDSISDKQ